MKILFSAVIAAIALAAVTTSADADPAHHMVKVCHMAHHHRVCHMVRR